MANDTSQQRRGPSDATDYSASKAPETQKEAEEQHAEPVDSRLHPGGAHGVAADPGMSSLDRDNNPTGARSPRQQDFGGRQSER